MLVARDEAAVEAAARAIRAKEGEALAIAADVGDKESAHRIAGQAAALAGAVDVLVHNASTLGPVPLAALLDTDCEDLERAFAVNLLGPVPPDEAPRGRDGAARARRRRPRHLRRGVEAYPGWGAYGVTKAALDHLTRIWAAELEADGRQLLAVDPGEMDTRMHADAMPDADRASLPSPDVAAGRIVRLIARGPVEERRARPRAQPEAAP